MSQEKQVREPKQRRSIEKTERIKEAALELFSERGYFQTTTNQIAKQAGLSIGTLYSYFKDKKDIYEELVKDHYLRAAESAHLDDIPLDASARDTMRFLVRSTWESHYLNTGLQKTIAALSAQSEELRAIEQKYRGNIVPVIAAFMMQHGELYRVDDYQTAALLVVTSLEAVIHEVVFYQGERDAETVIQELTDMFCAYLVKPEYLNENPEAPEQP